MDTRTGKIVDVTDVDFSTLEESLKAALVPIFETDLTEKQSEERQVSLHDHRSKLGKQLTRERADRCLTKNHMRKLRRQGKLS